MEVEPAAEVSATGARQTCQRPGIDCDAADPADNTHHGLVDRPFKRGDPNRACGREAQTKAKTKCPGLCIAAQDEGSAHALVGRRDRARLERLSTANAGDKLGRSDRITGPGCVTGVAASVTRECVSAGHYTFLLVRPGSSTFLLPPPLAPPHLDRSGHPGCPFCIAGVSSSSACQHTSS
jgi:hypothetical protein